MSNQETTSTDIPSVTQDLGVIPASEVKPEDVGTLSIRYTDGVPVLVVSGGTALPAGLTVVDESGQPVGLYTAGMVTRAAPMTMQTEAPEQIELPTIAPARDLVLSNEVPMDGSATLDIVYL